MTPAAIERLPAKNKFFDELEYGMTKAAAAPMVVLSPAAVTSPKASPTLPSVTMGSQLGVSAMVSQYKEKDP